MSLTVDEFFSQLHDNTQFLSIKDMKHATICICNVEICNYNCSKKRVFPDKVIYEKCY